MSIGQENNNPAVTIKKKIRLVGSGDNSKNIPTDVAIKEVDGKQKLGLVHGDEWLDNNNAIALGDGLNYDAQKNTLAASASGGPDNVVLEISGDYQGDVTVDEYDPDSLSALAGKVLYLKFDDVLYPAFYYESGASIYFGCYITKMDGSSSNQFVNNTYFYSGEYEKGSTDPIHLGYNEVCTPLLIWGSGDYGNMATFSGSNLKGKLGRNGAMLCYTTHNSTHMVPLSYSYVNGRVESGDVSWANVLLTGTEMEEKDGQLNVTIYKVTNSDGSMDWNIDVKTMTLK